MKVISVVFILTLTFSRNTADRESGHNVPSDNTTFSKNNLDIKSTNHTRENPPLDTGKFTEGGVIGKNDLKSQDKDDYLTLDFSSKKSSIKPRKGVPTSQVNDTQLKNDTPDQTIKNSTNLVENSTDKHVNISVNNNSVTEKHLKSDVDKLATQKPKSQDKNNTTDQKVNSTEKLTSPRPVKPTLTVSSDDDEDINPAPMRSAELSISNNHPDLVLPVVITVFALPLFAGLGYFALKHGREAWKNRHYRRMDFLLDGMYND